MVWSQISNIRRGKKISKQKIIYHLQDKENLEMTGIKKEIFNFKKGNQNSISSMYNLRCDPDHGVDENDIRRIIYVCNSCIKQLALPWDKNEKDYNQKRHDVNNNCLYWNVLSH